MFLNFDPHMDRLTLDTYGMPAAEYCFGVIEFADNYEAEVCSTMAVTDLHSDLIFPLEDGSIWQNSSVTKQTLLALHSVAVAQLLKQF